MYCGPSAREAYSLLQLGEGVAWILPLVGFSCLHRATPPPTQNPVRAMEKRRRPQLQWRLGHGAGADFRVCVSLFYRCVVGVLSVLSMFYQSRRCFIVFYWCSSWLFFQFLIFSPSLLLFIFLHLTSALHPIFALHRVFLLTLLMLPVHAFSRSCCVLCGLQPHLQYGTACERTQPTYPPCYSASRLSLRYSRYRWFLAQQ